MMRPFSLPIFCLLALSGTLLGEGFFSFLGSGETSSQPATNARATKHGARSPKTAAQPRTAPAMREETSREKALDGSSVRRFLAAWEARSAATARHLDGGRQRLEEDRAETGRITADRTLAALPSKEVRQLDFQEIGADTPVRGRHDWVRQFRATPLETATTKAGQAIKQAEGLAIRAGENLSARESIATGLLVPNLRHISGPPNAEGREEPYAVQNVDALRATVERKKAALAEDSRSARQDWQRWNVKAEALHRRYSELRIALPAAEETER